jgi:hypothetical protein
MIESAMLSLLPTLKISIFGSTADEIGIKYQE